MKYCVAHFVDAKTFGGCEEVVLNLLGGLNCKRWDSILFHLEEPGVARLVDQARRLGIRTTALPAVGGAWHAYEMMGLMREIQNAGPDIFHAHLGWPLGCRHAILAARLSGVPKVIATSHLYFPLNQVRLSWLKQTMQSAVLDRYIAVSGEVETRLREDLGVSRSKLRVVRNGIQLDVFHQDADPAFRAEITGGIDRHLVLTPARLHAQKGQDYLLEAATAVPGALFLLAGDGPDRDRLERKARDLGVHDRVRFLGHRTDVAKLLANCDLFVLPSLYEGLPLSVLEAMAAGKPVIATAVGGTDEAVIDGECGYLVPPGNTVALASAINALLSDRSVAERMAVAGRARVRRHFSAEAMVRGVEDVYEELLGTAAIPDRSAHG